MTPATPPRAEDVRRRAGNARELRAADALERLATREEHKTLERWWEWFEKKQAMRSKQQNPVARWLAEVEEDELVDTGKLDDYFAEDRGLRIDRDSEGKTVERDTIEEIDSLLYFAATMEPIGAFESLEKRPRDRRVHKIATLARSLASTLEKSDGPNVPPAIDLFEVKNAPLRLRLGNSPNSELWRSLQGQAVGPVLHRLAEWAEREGKRPPRDARRATGNPYARVVVRAAAFWFDHRHGSVQDNIVADVVNLLFRKLSIDAETVREWRGIK